MTDLISVYGPYLALALVALGWAARNIWPAIIKRDEAERAERREERQQLIELVRNNTAAMTEVRAAIDRLNDTVGFLSRDIGHIYVHLNLPRPTRPGRIDE